MSTLFMAGPAISVKALSETGEIEGYGSTFGGEPDAYGDIVAPGAYSESLAEHARKGTLPKMFWNHNRDDVIGRWNEMSEDSHGLKVRGKLNMEVQRGREAHALLKAGDIDGLSIGYRIRKFEKDEEKEVWTLTELDLVEVSVVPLAANENAVVTGVKGAHRCHEALEKLKAGDRLTEREFEHVLKGALGLSNSQAERAARLHLKGQGDPDDAEKDALEFLRALKS